MSFGIHTFKTRIDLIDPKDMEAFRRWSGQNKPSFAGRNFLGGDFLWARSEATNSRKMAIELAKKEEKLNKKVKRKELTEEDVIKKILSEKDPANLDILVERIAPIQAPQPNRQNQTGIIGFTLGVIDAQAICKKIYRSIEAGEFISSSKIVYVWLAVNDDISLSMDYWAGWSGHINEVTFGSNNNQLFRACILCKYNYDLLDLKFRLDTNVQLALWEAWNTYGSLNTTSYSFWADAIGQLQRVVDLGGIQPLPDLLWDEFETNEMPDIWRFANSDILSQVNLNIPSHIYVDAIRNTKLEENSEKNRPVTDYMLEVQKWQPSGDNVINIGFITTEKITDNGLDCLIRNPIPTTIKDNDQYKPFKDHSRQYTVKRINAKKNLTNVIGKYLLRDNPKQNLDKNQAERISKSGIYLFSIWERGRGQILNFNSTTGLEGKTWKRSDYYKYVISEDKLEKLDVSEEIKNKLKKILAKADRKRVYFFKLESFRTKIRDVLGKDNDDYKNYHKKIENHFRSYYIAASEYEYFRIRNDYSKGNDLSQLREEHGYYDGKEAFKYCAETLKQPSQTPVFFAVDVSQGPKVKKHDFEKWIEVYFKGVKLARDEFAQENPDFYYLIGVYGYGEILEWCYKRGIASYFWQGVGWGRRGNGRARFPWYHLNRWQYSHSDAEAWKRAKWKCDNKTYIEGADVDADWGDGGTWSLEDPLNKALHIYRKHPEWWQYLKDLKRYLKLLFHD